MCNARSFYQVTFGDNGQTLYYKRYCSYATVYSVRPDQQSCHCNDVKTETDKLVSNRQVKPFDGCIKLNSSSVAVAV